VREGEGEMEFEIVIKYFELYLFKFMYKIEFQKVEMQTYA